MRLRWPTVFGGLVFAVCVSMVMRPAPVSRTPVSAEGPSAHVDLEEAPVPDLVRLSALVPPEALRCDEPIPPESIFVTSSRGRWEVSIYAHSSYNGAPAESGAEAYSWSYRVELTNTGSGTVQLLTRHMVMTSATGMVEEVKGAGAGGKLPVLRPGESFETSGVAQLRTDRGSLRGSFQFEPVPTAPDLPGGGSFSAHVGRLALSSSGRAEKVPCAPEADVLARMLPPTSVFNSFRVLASVSIEHAPGLSDSDLFTYAFVYDVQVHNGRGRPLVVHGREWTFLDARGVTRTESGVGLGGVKGVGKVRLEPGQALRYQGTFTLPTPTGIAAGRLVVTLDESDVDRTTFDVLIAPAGCSVDGTPVPPIEHSSFLAAVARL